MTISAKRRSPKCAEFKSRNGWRILTSRVLVEKFVIEHIATSTIVSDGAGWQDAINAAHEIIYPHEKDGTRRVSALIDGEWVTVLPIVNGYSQTLEEARKVAAKKKVL